MEKDQNINSESQNEEIKETKVEKQIQVEQEISAEKTEEAKAVARDMKKDGVGASPTVTEQLSPG